MSLVNEDGQFRARSMAMVPSTLDHHGILAYWKRYDLTPIGIFVGGVLCVAGMVWALLPTTEWSSSGSEKNIGKALAECRAIADHQSPLVTLSYNRYNK